MGILEIDDRLIGYLVKVHSTTGYVRLPTPIHLTDGLIIDKCHSKLEKL